MSTALQLRTRSAPMADAPSLVEAAYRALKTAIREIYDVLIAVEGMAAARLAGLLEPLAASAAHDLDRATAAMERALALDDLSAWAAADEQFHQLLTDSCGNRRLARIAGTVMDQVHRSRLYTLHLRPKPLGPGDLHRGQAAALGLAAARDCACRTA